MALPFHLLARDDRPFDVVGLGLNSVDLLAVVDHFPAKDTKQRLEALTTLPGGQIATALSVCARLGWRGRFIGRFGDDDFGRLSRGSLMAEGIDVSAATVVAGATNQFAIILVDRAEGSRTVLWNRHPDLAIDPRTVPIEAVTAGRVLVVDCQETAAATEAARYARDAGMVTIVDVEKVRPGTRELLSHIDAIIAAEAFPCALTGESSQGRALEVMAREFSAPVVCVTLGREGSLARVDGREIRTPGFSVECVDSTGAGDAFRGGFAAGCLTMPDGRIEDVLAYANAVAALNCRGLGAQGGMPSADEVERLLSAREGRSGGSGR